MSFVYHPIKTLPSTRRKKSDPPVSQRSTRQTTAYDSRVRRAVKEELSEGQQAGKRLLNLEDVYERVVSNAKTDKDVLGDNPRPHILDAFTRLLLGNRLELIDGSVQVAESFWSSFAADSPTRARAGKRDRGEDETEGPSKGSKKTRSEARDHGSTIPIPNATAIKASQARSPSPVSHSMPTTINPVTPKRRFEFPPEEDVTSTVASSVGRFSRVTSTVASSVGRFSRLSDLSPIPNTFSVNTEVASLRQQVITARAHRMLLDHNLRTAVITVAELRAQLAATEAVHSSDLAGHTVESDALRAAIAEKHVQVASLEMERDNCEAELALLGQSCAELEEKWQGVEDTLFASQQAVEMKTIELSAAEERLDGCMAELVNLTAEIQQLREGSSEAGCCATIPGRSPCTSCRSMSAALTAARLRIQQLEDELSNSENTPVGADHSNDDDDETLLQYGLATVTPFVMNTVRDLPFCLNKIPLFACAICWATSQARPEVMGYQAIKSHCCRRHGIQEDEVNETHLLYKPYGLRENIHSTN